MRCDILCNIIVLSRTGGGVTSHRQYPPRLVLQRGSEHLKIRRRLTEGTWADAGGRDALGRVEGGAKKLRRRLVEWWSEVVRWLLATPSRAQRLTERRWRALRRRRCLRVQMLRDDDVYSRPCDGMLGCRSCCLRSRATALHPRSDQSSGSSVGR